MAEMEKEGRPPENKRSRKPAHPVKREINEEMKVFSDSGAGETELFIPSAPFGLLCRLRGGQGRACQFLPGPWDASAPPPGAKPKPTHGLHLRNLPTSDLMGAGGTLFNLTNPRSAQMLPGEGIEPQWRVSLVQRLSRGSV